MIQRLTVMFLALVVLSVACKSADEAMKDNDPRPSFIKSPPRDTPEYLYETGIAESVNMATSERAAMNNAREAIAQKLESRVESMQKNFEEELRSGGVTNANYTASFNNVVKSVSSATLSGLERTESIVNPLDSGGFIAYILVRYPVGEAAEVLQNALSKEEELYIKFKESKAFKELEEEIKKYKEVQQ